MPSELDLLRSLDDEPRTASTVDIRRAIDVGRRRRVRRGAGYAGVAGLTALAVAGVSVAGTLATPHAAATGATSAPAATPPTSCTLTRLPIPDNAPMALVAGADPTGQYVVGRSYPKAGGYQAVIWHDGAATKVMLPGDLEELLRDVNSAGEAVGWSYVGGADTGPVPYAYRNGKVSKLPGVRRGSANAINDAGTIVGDDDGHNALLWPSASANPTRLPTPPGTTRATANGIDEDGTTVGTIDGKAYVWFPDGTHRALPTPTLNGKPATTSQAFGIRDGWVTGVAATGGLAAGTKARGGGQAAAVRWNLHTGEVRVFEQLKHGANAVNAQGWQIGTDDKGRAVLVTSAGTVVLPDLSAHEADGLGTIASTLSDDGRTIGGQSDNATGTIQPIVWRCH